MIIIFIVAFALLMRLLLYLVRHPDIDIDLDGKVMAHEPSLEEVSNLVLTYLHEEEQATYSEIITLLESEEVASSVISFLVRRGEIVAEFDGTKDEEVLIKLLDE